MSYPQLLLSTTPRRGAIRARNRGIGRSEGGMMTKTTTTKKTATTTKKTATTTTTTTKARIRPRREGARSSPRPPNIPRMKCRRRCHRFLGPLSIPCRLRRCIPCPPLTPTLLLLSPRVRLPLPMPMPLLSIQHTAASAILGVLSGASLIR